ncbi:hypothetical protein [Nocardia gamkensis]|uniref:hypothetical protein n=1 Tax=Nocardia gamkensis TaxID=352869 RepID=UPI001FE1392A|nr:hypothetical protein [Nocardia gamkensis]
MIVMVERPVWARRIRALREAKGLSQAAAAEAMRAHAGRVLPDAEHLVRRWKAWELGENKPGREYAQIVAATLGTVTASLFPVVAVLPDVEASPPVLSALRPSRFSFAGVCIWCEGRDCVSPVCVNRHNLSEWEVCPACAGMPWRQSGGRCQCLFGLVQAAAKFATLAVAV